MSAHRTRLAFVLLSLAIDDDDEQRTK